MLVILSEYISQIPAVAVDGIFGPATRSAVLAAQRYFGLPQTGVVDANTWDTLYDAFSGIETTSLDDGENYPDIRQQTAPKNRYSTTTTMTQYPGSEMRVGSSDPVAQEVVR